MDHVLAAVKPASASGLTSLRDHVGGSVLDAVGVGTNAEPEVSRERMAR